MTEKIKHPDNVRGYVGPFSELPKDVASLAYDKLALFLKILADDLIRQADADTGRDRKKLAKSLSEAAKNINAAKENIDSAWKICKPFMPDNR